MAVGMSLFLFILPAPPLVLLSFAVIFTSSFMLHELAHKLTAQHHGLWAEFRITLIGALVTLLSIFSPLKIISPGAVMIAGSGSEKTLGKVSLAGPLVNLLLSATFVGVSMFSADYLFLIAVLSGFFNASIALINLIPLGILDGLKVFGWNKTIWAAAFLSSLTLFIWAFIHVEGLF